MLAALIALAAATLPDVALQSLARGLDAPDFAARERATARLIAAGEPALPAVRRLLAGPQVPEVKRRLEVVEERLMVAGLSAARRVTLDARDAPLAEVLAEITRQTGYAFTTADAYGFGLSADARVSVTVTGAPFLKAVDALCDGNCLGTDQCTSEGVVPINTRRGTRSLRGYAGPYRLTMWDKPQPLPGSDAPNSDFFGKVGVGITSESEPKNVMVEMVNAYAVSSVDRRGRRTDYPDPPPAGTTPSYCEPSRGFRHSTILAIPAGGGGAESFAELTVKFTAVLIVETRVVGRVADLTKAATEKMVTGDVTAWVDRVDVRGDGLVVSVGLTRGCVSVGDEWSFLAGQRLRFTDAAGKKVELKSTALTTHANRPGVTFYECEIDRGKAAPGPISLEFSEWRTRERDVTVTLKTAPLP